MNVAKLYMYLSAYVPGVSIQVCSVCMLNMNARYLMVTHLQGLPGRSVFRQMWNIFQLCCPAETDPHVLKSCGYNDP